MNNTWIIEWIMLALSNEFCSNHRMNISWIIEWILLALLHKCRRESNAYQGEFIEFCYNFIECISKMKYIWILLSICGNNQTHISDIEYWHISATIKRCLEVMLWYERNAPFYYSQGALSRLSRNTCKATDELSLFALSSAMVYFILNYS